VASPGAHLVGARRASPPGSGAYELLLRCPGCNDELRVTDHLEAFVRDSDLVEFRGRRWRVVATEPASGRGFVARLVCAPAV
jgi:hypothetical protein